MKQIGSLHYSPQEEQYLEDSWGMVTIDRISKVLNRPIGGISDKVARMNLGAFLNNGEYITVRQLFIAIGRQPSTDCTFNQWEKKGCPFKKKKVNQSSYNIIFIDEFWKWAKKYRMHIDFNKFKENALGEEPSWVHTQRKADVAYSKYKMTTWTPKEDNHLKSLLKLYKYTYSQISVTLFRTEGGIKRRVLELGILERPLREDSHGIWTDDAQSIVIEMYNKGYRSEVIREFVNKSSQAISGKVERLIKDGLLIKWK